MNKAKRVWVLALAGLVILSVLASTSIAYGAKNYYVRGHSGGLTERVPNIDSYTPTGHSWRFPAGAETPHGWELNRGYGITDHVRDYLNQSTQSQYQGYRIFSPRNATGYNATEQLPEENTFGRDDSGSGMMDNVRWYMNNQGSGNNMLVLDGWKIFGEN
ncbi:MAG: hypothetical protein U9R10_04605 [Euryarchaeota archaeon]|nr:hypothetical protein [Euryarchaeota archaeon]